MNFDPTFYIIDTILKGEGTVLGRNNAEHLEQHVNNAIVQVKR